MTLALALIFAFMLGAQFGRIRTLKMEMVFGERCERDACGWWYRKPEFRDWLHEQQDGIEPSDFRPLQGICLAAHFKPKIIGRDVRPIELRTYQRWRVNPARRQ